MFKRRSYRKKSYKSYGRKKRRAGSRGKSRYFKISRGGIRL